MDARDVVIGFGTGGGQRGTGRRHAEYAATGGDERTILLSTRTCVEHDHVGIEGIEPMDLLTRRIGARITARSHHDDDRSALIPNDRYLRQLACDASAHDLEQVAVEAD